MNNTAGPTDPRSQPAAAGATAVAESLPRSGFGKAVARLDVVEVLRILDQCEGTRTDLARAVDAAYERYEAEIEAGRPVNLAAFCEQFGPHEDAIYELLNTHELFEDTPSLASKKLDFDYWPEPGQTYLEFVLIRELGRGAFSRVFLATQTTVGGRQVVVKVSRLGVAAEAQALGELEHPNIVPILAPLADPATGLTCICMPYLGGATLRDLLNRVAGGDSPPQRARVIEEVIQSKAATAAADGRPKRRAMFPRANRFVDAIAGMAAELAEALAYVHAKGICHRDLKPSNVLLGIDGRARLLDFSIAARRGDEQLIGGTLPYMSPEQLRGPRHWGGVAASVVNERADLFALAAMTYELLAGQHPFGPFEAGASVKAIRVRLLERHPHGPRPIRSINNRVDARLAGTVERCLAFDPRQRPQSVGEFAAALRRSLRLDQRLRRWVVSHARLAAAAAAVLLLVTGSGAYYLAQRDPYSIRQWHYGQEAFRTGQFAQAVEHFSMALRDNPNLTEALLDRGRARLRQGEYNFALADFRGTAERASDGRLEALIAGCYVHLQQHSNALIHYERAVQGGYAPAEVCNNLGYCAALSGDYRKAASFLGQAVELGPDLQPAYFNRAVVRLRFATIRQNKNALADAEAGMADVDRAAAIGPASAELHFIGACLSARAAKNSDALNHIRLAIDLGLDPTRLNDALLVNLDKVPVGDDLPTFQQLKRRPVPSSPPQKPVRLAQLSDE